MMAKGKGKGLKDKKKRISRSDQTKCFFDIRNKTKQGHVAKYDSFCVEVDLDAKDGDDAEVGNSNTGDRVGRNNRVHFEQVL
jgi:hypothetical protein